MKSPRKQLEERVSAALVQLLGEAGAAVDPLIRPTQDPRFGDFQSNVAMGLRKQLGGSPREVAARLIAALDVADLCAEPEIAGPGFLNFRILPSFLASQLEQIQGDDRLGAPLAEQPQRVVVDFSSPNLAKEMHVGHIRSTIIGDALARVLEFCGHDVLRLNHVGDWGTPFGMLIQSIRETRPEVLERPDDLRIDDLESFYVDAKRRFDSDPEFAVRARKAVVDLQAGDESALAVWRAFCRESLRHAHEIYERLQVRLTDRGESFYNPVLPGMVEELLQRGLAIESDGAICFFVGNWTNRDGKPLPLMVRKSDGGYNYDTTDLAGVRHRILQEKAVRIIYVTDIRQRQHFDMVFEGARAAGWAGDEVSLEHVGFGMVLGEDRRPFKTRDGGTVKLKALLDEAVTRSREFLEQNAERMAELTDEERTEIAWVVGHAAVKYADLSHNVSSDYIFAWDTMLALEGNTAAYMLYAVARTRSIGRKAGIAFEELPTDLPILVEHESEIGLAKTLLEFPGVVEQVAQQLRPHLLTDYMYALSRAFSTFYDRERGVRVVDVEDEAVRLSRLRLCDLTARTLKTSLSLLGIDCLEKM